MRNKIFWLLLGSLAAALALRAADGPPDLFDLDAPGAGVKPAAPKFELDDPRATRDITVPIPAGTGEVKASFRIGPVASDLKLTLVWNNGSKTNIQFRPAATTMKRKLAKEAGPDSGAAGATANWERDEKTGKLVREVEASVANACLEILPWRTRYYVRPNPEFYNDTARDELFRKVTRLPSASEHEFDMSLRLEDGDARLYLDGNYIGRLGKAAGLKETVWVLPAAMEKKIECLPAAPGGERWLALDLKSLDRPGVMQGATLALREDELQKMGVPWRGATGGVDVAVNWMRNVCPPLNYDDCYYPFLSRSAFDAMPESLLMSVPSAPYVRVWVLCAAEDDPAKDPRMIVRLIRYRKGGIGNAMVNTEVSLPRAGEPPGPGLARAGDVTYTVSGTRKTVPLWLAEVSLNSGEIQDVKYSDWAGGRLDFELLGKDYRNRAVMNGVHVFAMTLEKTPIEMEVRQTVPGNVFHNDDKPEVKVAVRALASSATAALRWVVSDVWSNQVASGEQKIELAAGGAEQVITVPLAMKENGWYQAVFSLANDRGGVLRHTAAFAQLGPDTRKAGYESRYGCWWQPALHGGTEDPNLIGPLLLKAGIRRTTRTCRSESNMAPWKVTIDMVPWKGPESTNTPQEWIVGFEEHVRDCLKAFPHTGLAMIFHESYGAKSLAPGELAGGEPDPVRTNTVAVAKLASAMFREKFPGLKIIIGNSNWAGDQMSMLLRGGLPPDGVDGLGMERLLNLYRYGSLQPEMHEASWCLRQIGLKYGCQAPPSDCYESGGRGGAHGMAPRMSAEFLVRDSLVGWSWNYPYIGVGCVSENVYGYYTTIYGGDSLVRRFPLLYPTPSYVAVATMTRVLDSVAAPRRLATGSHTVYALEFPRGDERVYALWTPRGFCEMTLKFPKDVAVTINGLYGNSRQTNSVNGELSLKAGEEVTYVTAPLAAAGVAAGQRAFPKDDPPAAAVVLDRMDDAGRWIQANARALDKPIPCGGLPWRIAGEGRLSEVADPERGKCLRVDLVSADPKVALVSETVTFLAREALPLPGTPHTLGVWVKGNSSWGRVIFEIMDAEGERFRGGTDDSVNPAGTSLINFDGWCFVSLPLTADSPQAAGYLRGNASGLWSGNGGNGKIDTPVRVTGLSLELKRHGLDLTEMAPVDPALCLKDLSAY